MGGGGSPRGPALSALTAVKFGRALTVYMYMYKKRSGVISCGDQRMATTGKLRSATLFAGAAFAAAAVASR